MTTEPIQLDGVSREIIVDALFSVLSSANALGLAEGEFPRHKIGEALVLLEADRVSLE